MKPSVIFLFGPPGSGKSTQAELVAKRFNAVHLDAGALLRRILKNPLRAHDPKIQEERIKQEIKGQLNDSIWVASLIIGEIKKLHQKGKNVVSSGWPRTIFEAEVEFPVLGDLYGDRLFVIDLQVSPATTLFRNSNRRMCSLCNRIFSWSADSKSPDLCPSCGGTLIIRNDDKPDVIKHRLEIYKARTERLLEYFAEKKIKKIEIDGESSPEAVFAEIERALARVL